MFGDHPPFVFSHYHDQALQRNKYHTLHFLSLVTKKQQDSATSFKALASPPCSLFPICSNLLWYFSLRNTPNIKTWQVQQNKLCNIIIMLLTRSPLKTDFKCIICHMKYINNIRPVHALSIKEYLLKRVNFNWSFKVFCSASKPIPLCWQWEIKGLIMKIF